MVDGPLSPALYKEVGAGGSHHEVRRDAVHPTYIPYRSRVSAVLTGSTATATLPSPATVTMAGTGGSSSHKKKVIPTTTVAGILA